MHASMGCAQLPVQLFTQPLYDSPSPLPQPRPPSLPCLPACVGCCQALSKAERELAARDAELAELRTAARLAQEAKSAAAAQVR